MKTSLVILSLAGIALVVAGVVRLKTKAPPVAPEIAEIISNSARQPPPPMDAEDEEPLESTSQKQQEPARISIAIPAATDAASATATATNAVPEVTAFSRAIDTLVSAHASFGQKYQTWQQLRDSGQMDHVIEALKQGAAENPASAAYPAALGQAQLCKAGVISRNGGTISEMGILGMQADQNFDAALKLDPANWEAQFFKATAMSHWPLELNKGEEVIQRLSKLIDQQDATPPQPQFAQTYVILGDQYQKMGRPEYAAATWEIGARKFPANPELQQRIRQQ